MFFNDFLLFQNKKTTRKYTAIEGWFDSFFMFTNFLILFDFVESQTYICDFHREQAWKKWLAKSSNGLMDQKQKILAKLRAIARARTEKEYLVRVRDLQSSEEWRTNNSLSNYITKTWLPQHKVHACTLATTYALISFAKKTNFVFFYRNGYGHSEKTDS